MKQYISFHIYVQVKKVIRVGILGRDRVLFEVGATQFTVNKGCPRIRQRSRSYFFAFLYSVCLIRECMWTIIATSCFRKLLLHCLEVSPTIRLCPSLAHFVVINLRLIKPTQIFPCAIVSNEFTLQLSD